MTRSLDRPVRAPPEAAPPTSPPRSQANGETEPVLVAAGIEKAYRRGIWPARRATPVLSGIDLALHPGEVVGLVGENGSGKSTPMGIRVGAGTVTVRGRLGYCPQGRSSTTG